MTKEELIDKYKEYCELLPKGPSNDDTRSDYASYISALRFWAIDVILKDWNVTQKNNKYYETFDSKNIKVNKKGEKSLKALKDWTKGSYVECSEWNFYLCNYYKKYIQGQNKLKKGNTKAYECNRVVGYDYLKYIAAFLGENDLVHALTIIEIVMGITQKALDQSKRDTSSVKKNDIKYLRKSRRALALMREWIEFGKTKDMNNQEHLSFSHNVVHAADKETQKMLDELRSNIDSKLIHKIDGAIALVREIGVDRFIQYAIEQSYFFEPCIVKEQMNEIVSAFQQKPTPNELDARSSTKVTSDDTQVDDTQADDSQADDSQADGTIDTYDDNSSEKVYYHQYVDYVRTALAYAKDAQKNATSVQEKKKKSDKENAVKAARTLLMLAQSAAKKVTNINDNEINNAKNAVDEAEKEVFGDDIPKNQLSDKKIEEKVDKSKYRLFHSSDLKRDYPIVIDSDGNKAVRKLIEDKTGYSVSKGKSSIFQNYKISHIWGRAYDPRYFTNLWNIVLVPAWANDLLDKNAVEKTLESKFKSTIMRICWVLYFDRSNNNSINNKLWKILDMKDSPKNVNEEDIVSSTSVISIPVNTKTLNDTSAKGNKNPYLINIIEGKGDKTLGDIVKYAVYV